MQGIDPRLHCSRPETERPIALNPPRYRLERLFALAVIFAATLVTLGSEDGLPNDPPDRRAAEKAPRPDALHTLDDASRGDRHGCSVGRHGPSAMSDAIISAEVLFDCAVARCLWLQPSMSPSFTGMQSKRAYRDGPTDGMLLYFGWEDGPVRCAPHPYAGTCTSR